MIDLVRATRVEVIKLRRTLALSASVFVPVAVIAMTTAMNLSRATGTRFDPDQPNSWDSLMLDLVLFVWCLVGLAPFISLETALRAGLEHRENAWKHLFALSIPDWTIYVPKLLVAFALVLVRLVPTSGLSAELLAFVADACVPAPIRPRRRRGLRGRSDPGSLGYRAPA
jgi:lantibiotic transport system permease protein